MVRSREIEYGELGDIVKRRINTLYGRSFFTGSLNADELRRAETTLSELNSKNLKALAAAR